MSERWSILAALTLARASMGFQFQALPSVGEEVADAFTLSYAALGFAYGLYLLPGVAVALPGGWLGRRYGDKRMVLAGLAAMCAGGLLQAAAVDASTLFAGRGVAGAGAVILNVLATKMVADWFAPRELPTAMGVFISSWPVGIALGLLIAPPLAEAHDWRAAMLATAAFAALGLALVAWTYRPAPNRSADSAPPPPPGLSPRETAGAVLSGAVWTFYNVGFILPLAFGAAALVARDVDPIEASATVSLLGWLIIPGLVGGGWLAARAGRPDLLTTLCLAAAAALIWTLPSWGVAALLPIALIGLLFGPPGPLTMALPVSALRPENRAVGMGVYFTCYYVGMAAAPPLAGWARDATASPDAPLRLAALSLLLAVAALFAFRAAAPRP